MIRRRTTQPAKQSSRFTRLGTPDLETALETSLQRTAELFRGMMHKEIDTRWLLAQMATEIDQADQIVQVLLARVEG